MVLAGVNGVKFGVNRSLKVSLTGVNTVLIGVNLVTGVIRVPTGVKRALLLGVRLGGRRAQEKYAVRAPIGCIDQLHRPQ